jgi:branched-chain amino acid transport system ATP-binding protein
MKIEAVARPTGQKAAIFLPRRCRRTERLAHSVPGEAEPLLAVDGLRAGYGHVEVLHGVSLSVRAAQIVAIVGPNGAGKTTLMSAVMGLVPRRGGTVHYLGNPAGTTEVLVAAGALLVPEQRALFTDMTVEDNLLLGFYARRRAGERDARPSMHDVFAIFPRLKERRRQLAATLSGGERQMLALGRALMGSPRLLLLDEPSLGLAPMLVREIFRVLVQLRRSGLSILLVEQNVRAALRVADYGYVLEMGEVAAEGPAADLALDHRILETYLGQRRAGIRE